MWPEALRKYPFLRLLLPLAVGIVCGDASPHTFSWSLFASISAGWLAALYLCHRRCWRKMYGSMALLWLVFLGYQLSARAWAATDYDFPHREATYRVRLCEAAEEKKRSFLCPARVLGVYQSDTLRAERRPPLFLLYFAKDSAAARLQRGDELLVHVRLNPPRNNGNPDEFDYARYLRRQGGSGTAYVPAHRWRATGHDSTRTLRQAALDQRERVVDLYRRLGFRGDHLTVLSALTVGDQDDLSDDITETYTVAGASHVLSLSGLHIGFLYVLLLVFCRPVWMRWRALKLPLLLLIVAGLWAFAFFTGLASPVVRSVTMVMILALAALQSEKLLTMNTLAATAFLMLVARPLWLFDVSFQLSFLSLAAILLFQPPLYALWRPRWRLLRHAWGLATVTLAAQAGTVPLVLLYFSRFSTHFLLSNLWVVPLSSLILYAAVVLLLLTPFPAWQGCFAHVADALVGLQNGGLRWISRLPYASFDHVWVDAVDIWLFYLFLLCFCLCLRRFTFRRVCVALAALLLLASYHTIAGISSHALTAEGGPSCCLEHAKREEAAAAFFFEGCNGFFSCLNPARGVIHPLAWIRIP